MRARVLALLLPAICASCAIDLGAAPDAACHPSPDFFVAEFAPRYLELYQCATRRCHDFSDGSGTMRLRPFEAAPAPGTPLDAWPLGWRENYLSAKQLVRCDAPLESRLLTVPEGLGNLHPPGPIVRDRPAAAALFEAWVGAPTDGGAGDAR